jgi:hypothetical protein
MTAKAAPAAEAQRRQGNAKEIQARIALRVGLPGLVFLGESLRPLRLGGGFSDLERSFLE